MAYTWLTSTLSTITSDVLQDNFTELFNGDVFPRTAVTATGAMTITNNTSNLGLSTSSWNKLYCKTIDINQSMKARESVWQERFYIMLSAVTAAIKVTTPDELVAEEYFINFYAWCNSISSVQSINMQFNSITGYGRQGKIHYDLGAGLSAAVASPIQDSSNDGMLLSVVRQPTDGASNVTFFQFANAHVFIKSGLFRVVKTRFGGWDETADKIASLGQFAHSWVDTSTLITDFNFDGAFYTGTVIEIQARV